MTFKLFNTKSSQSLTLFLLCAGYFIDFYDLTLMGASYHALISEQFYMTDTAQIQQIYLTICNFQTLGIFIGAILFGILGDKLGRAQAIRYSILLYSFATLAAVYTHSLPLFIFLRVLAYIGLSSEFATSTVLILELFSVKSAAWGTALLYSFGVCGGILATTISIFSWKAMFLFGGGIGFLLYIARGQIQESTVYLYAKQQAQEQNKQPLLGSLRVLWGQKEHCFRLFRYLLMTMPYYALISIMFIFPNAIIHQYTLGYATQILLLGFFSGNIISSLLSGLFVQYCQNTKLFIGGSFILFIILMSIFPYIPESYLGFYSLGLGLLGGGCPILLMQQFGRDVPVPIRSLACNTLFALGRASSIGFNLLMSYWVMHPDTLVANARWTVSIIFIGAFLSLLMLRRDNKTLMDHTVNHVN